MSHEREAANKVPSEEAVTKAVTLLRNIGNTLEQIIKATNIDTSTNPGGQTGSGLYAKNTETIAEKCQHCKENLGLVQEGCTNIQEELENSVKRSLVAPTLR